MAKYFVRKKANGTYDISVSLGMRGDIYHRAAAKGVKRQDVRATAENLAKGAQTARDVRKGIQVDAGIEGVTE